jgi:hypothetical protein
MRFVRRVAPWIGAWVALALAFTLVLSAINLPRELELARGFGTATGTVTAKQPENHATVRYEYSVASQAYSGVATFLGPPNPPFQQLQVGRDVTVYYGLADPSKSALEDPRSLVLNELVSIAAAAILGPTALLAFIALSPRRRRRLRRTPERVAH